VKKAIGEGNVRKTLIIGIAALALAPTLTDARELHGVRWDTVDWDRLCASVEPLEYSTEQGHVCRRVHPTASQWEKWRDMTGRNMPEPDWDCDQLAQHFDAYSQNAGLCKQAFKNALSRRSRYQERYSESFESWREHHFSPWLVGRK
jgi:hypothetical protein